jgi:hypothetical protein
MATHCDAVGQDTACNPAEPGTATTFQVSPPSGETSTSGAATITHLLTEGQEMLLMVGVPPGTATGVHVRPPSIDRASEAVCGKAVVVPQATQVKLPETQVTPDRDRPAGRAAVDQFTPPSEVHSAAAVVFQGDELLTVTHELVVAQAMPVGATACSGLSCSVQVTPPSTDFSIPRPSGT